MCVLRVKAVKSVKMMYVQVVELDEFYKSTVQNIRPSHWLHKLYLKPDVDQAKMYGREFRLQVLKAKLAVGCVALNRKSVPVGVLT